MMGSFGLRVATRIATDVFDIVGGGGGRAEVLSTYTGVGSLGYDRLFVQWRDVIDADDTAGRCVFWTVGTRLAGLKFHNA